MNVLLIALLLQSLALPPRSSMENPAAFYPIPQKVKKDYDKAWTRFIGAKEDAKLASDLTRLLKKQKEFDAVVMVQAYLDLHQGKQSDAAVKFEQLVSRNPANRIALYYLAEMAYANNDYARASDIYARLLEIDTGRPELEMKRQKALLLATENLLRNAARAEAENRFAEAESLYYNALRIAPREPSFHGLLGNLLAKQGKWDEALTHYSQRIELEGPSDENNRNMAAALMNVGRTEEARAILDRMRDAGTVDAELEEKVRELENLGRWGSAIQRLHEIQSTSALTREQLSAMLIRYFPQITEFRQTPQIVTDIQDSWARPEIQTVVSVGLIDSYPNHTFRPSSKITRAEFAASLSRLMRMLTVAPADAPPIEISDVAPANAHHADVQFVVGHGLMTLDDAGSFSLDEEVSGDEALRAMMRLLQIARGKEA